MRPVIVILFTVFAWQLHAQADLKFVRRGNKDFENKQYQQAEIQYRKALEKNSESEAADFNLGNALYKQNQFDVAASRYAALAAKQADRQSLSRRYYNLGNALYKSGKYKESIEAYKQALRQNPNDLDAKHNLQLAMKKLEEENRQNQQDKQNEQNSNDQNRQPQKNKDQNEENRNNDNNPQKNPAGNDNPNEPQQQQGSKGQISPEDAERILQALENEEKNVLKKVQEKREKVQKVPVEKNW
jgi:Ca-activated chloride channel homolog